MQGLAVLIQSGSPRLTVPWNGTIERGHALDLPPPRRSWVFKMKTTVTTPPVDIALRTMNADEVQRVHAWFDHLRNWDADAYVRNHSHKLSGLQDTYLLKTNTDLRIFFRIDGDTITILDVAKKSAIYTSGRTP